MAPELVTLKGGTHSLVAALRVLWGLKDRHFYFQVDGHLLLVRPNSGSHRTTIRRFGSTGSSSSP